MSEIQQTYIDDKSCCMCFHRFFTCAYCNCFSCCNCWFDRWIQYTRVEEDSEIFQKESYLMCCCWKVHFKVDSNETCKFYEKIEDKYGLEFEVIHQ